MVRVWVLMAAAGAGAASADVLITYRAEGDDDPFIPGIEMMIGEPTVIHISLTSTTGSDIEMIGIGFLFGSVSGVSLSDFEWDEAFDTPQWYAENNLPRPQVAAWYGSITIPADGELPLATVVATGLHPGVFEMTTGAEIVDDGKLEVPLDAGSEAILFNVLGDAIPTVSEWGLVVTTLLGATAGTLVFGRRRVAA